VIKGRSDQKSFLTVRDVVIRDVITSHRKTSMFYNVT
jgi:hypothetical protein